MITCLVVSHNKPQYVKESIESLINQTYQDWDAVVMDSGILYDGGYFGWVTDRRIKVVRSTETPQLRVKKAMAPWCFNECYRRGFVKGDYITYLCDDDIWYDNAFEVFAEFTRGRDAVYASQDVAVIDPSGNKYVVGERRATEIRYPGMLDCKVDYLQFCHSRRIIEKLAPEYWPETRSTERHADGVFMERVAGLTPVYPIDIKVSQNRRTPVSTYGPS